MNKLRTLCVVSVVLAAGTRASAQEPACAGSFVADGLVTTEAAHERLLETLGAIPADGGLIRRAGTRVHDCVAAVADPWAAHTLGPADDGDNGLRFAAVPVRLRVDYLSAYPSDRNNGALWSGRGVSSSLSGGARAGWGPLSVALAPVVAFQQNQRFALREPLGGIRVSRYSYPFGRIDFPQRFGDGAFWTVDPGQSYARVDAFGAALGVSTENLWWGPGQWNSIVMGSSAAGVPHAFLGTSGPLGSRIGAIEAEMIWGRMTESEYFDTVSNNGDRLLTGIILSYAPAFLPGLTLGVSRLYYQTIPPEGLDFEDYVPFFETPLKEALADSLNPEGNDVADQIGAIYARWVLPESMFEVYAEFARNDHSWDFHDALTEPDHSQAYTLGFAKAMGSSARLWRLSGELTHLTKPVTTLHRTSPSYYRHGRVRQGYTNDGQLLGAWIGPGSDAQHVGVDMLEDWGLGGLYVERIRHDADAYFNIDSISGKWPWRHDVELGFGARGAVRLGDLDVRGDLALFDRRSRYFVKDRRERNWMLMIEATWMPRERGRFSER